MEEGEPPVAAASRPGGEPEPEEEPLAEVSRLRAQLAAKDEAMAANERAMSAKDHKIAQLEALLQGASAGGNA